MWINCFALSFICLAISLLIPLMLNLSRSKKGKKISVFRLLCVGVFAAAFFMFFPLQPVTAESVIAEYCQRILLSVFNSMKVFAAGTEYEIVVNGIVRCPEQLNTAYQIWISAIFVLAPIMTFGFVLSMFKNLSAHIKYFFAVFKERYIFSEMNDKSLALATDIKKKNKNAVIVFTDVFDENDERSYEMIDRAVSIGAICFKKDLLAINFKKSLFKKQIRFFTIGENEAENLNQALMIIENYRDCDGVNLYVFSTKVESEILLTAIDKGKIKVRRINQVQSLINNILYKDGVQLFTNANEETDGVRDISAVVIGMGCHGREMVKALSWFGQMDGYRIKINAFDKDELADKKFIAIAPELMSPEYNGVIVDGEAQYTITVHPSVDVESVDFADRISSIKDTSYVLVALGDDDINVNTAVYLRMLYERMGIHPVIQAIVYNTQQKKALTGIKNYGGQEYDIDFIGDLESHFTEDVILDSALEADALKRHLKWGKEEEFWTYEYNYRSSTASAIHMKARIALGIAGAHKTEEELTDEERDIIERLEHRRWNAYMRSEGYVFSGSTDKSSRNDLGKMHHDLVDFAALPDDVKRLDSKVGTK